MKRVLFFILVVAAGVGAYGWYRGDLPRWGRQAKAFLESYLPGGSSANAPENDMKAPPPPALARVPAEALAALRSDDAVRRNTAWEQLSRLYKEDPSLRDVLAPPLEQFTSQYVLSDLRDESVAEIVNVRPGYSLSRIAEKRGTTADAIKRINKIARDMIHPGESLKVLNRPIEIFVSRREFRLWVTYGGLFLTQMRCGIGKGNRTPPGTYVIAEKQRNPDWYRKGEKVIPAGDPANELGCCWLGFADTRESGLGIHEAKDGRGLGQESSQGCIRVEKSDVELLYDLTPYRTVVTIME